MRYIKLQTEWDSQEKIFEDINTDGYERIPETQHDDVISNEIEDKRGYKYKKGDIESGSKFWTTSPSVTDFNSIEVKSLSELGFNRIEKSTLPAVYKEVLSYKELILPNIPRTTDWYVDRRIYIYKLRDDWYHLVDVDISNAATRYKEKFTYYRCDQLEGLLNCLKKEFNI
jgi:hypothetical protein